MRSRIRVKATPRFRRQRDARGGYVLVALLASSAIMLATLALAIPRMAVQSQRIKEETLVYRGKQYRRAIELYFREHKKYPEELDDLEDTNGVRYLRKRYRDPLTGEDQWRLIHVGKDGRFKDSLIYDLAEEVEESGEEDGFGSSFGRSSAPSSFGAGGPAPGQGTAPFSLGGSPGLGSGVPAQLADRRSGMIPGAPQPGQFQGGARARAVRQSVAPDGTQQVRYNQGFEFPVGAPQPGQGQGTVPRSARTGNRFGSRPTIATCCRAKCRCMRIDRRRPDPNAPFGQQGQQGPGRPGFVPGRGLQSLGGVLPAGVLPQQTGGRPAYGAGSAPGQSPFPVLPPGASVGGAPAAFGPQGAGASATNIIQRLLTTPRPGGLAGLQGYQQVQAAGAAGAAAAFTEGIAGVASMVEDFGVKTYQGREMYNEWEFVYDYRKDMGNGTGLAGGQPGSGAPRGLGMNPGMAGGIAPNRQQGIAAPRSPAPGGFGGFGAAGGRAPGTASRPGSGYGAQPGGAGPYQPSPNGPYQPPGTPAPSPYETIPGAPNPSRTDGPQPLYPPPAPHVDPRRK